MKRLLMALAAVAVAAAGLSASSGARDRPFGAADLVAMKWGPAPEAKDIGAAAGQTGAGGQFSKEQIERFRCSSAGNPAISVDISCNTTAYGQDWNPDNEIAVCDHTDDPAVLDNR